MAVFTSIDLAQANKLAQSHQIAPTNKLAPIAEPAPIIELAPVPAGSVNTNYIATLASGDRTFLRIYEESTPASAASEWALLAFLSDHDLPVPRLQSACDPKHIPTVQGKATGFFHLIGGDEICQKGVTPWHMEHVGAFLGKLHACGKRHANPPHSRFGPAQLRDRLSAIDKAITGAKPNGMPAERARTLRKATTRLSSTLDALLDTHLDAEAALPEASSTIIHSDLFRDNVRWSEAGIEAVLDWESASEGNATFDLMVTAMAWCYGDAFDATLTRALCAGYTIHSGDASIDAASAFHYARLACVRFAITRITDFELKPAVGERIHKDYRRFLARLSELETMGPGAWAQMLGLATS